MLLAQYLALQTETEFLISGEIQPTNGRNKSTGDRPQQLDPKRNRQRQTNV